MSEAPPYRVTLPVAVPYAFDTPRRRPCPAPRTW
jgi:hypothetical protein